MHWLKVSGKWMSHMQTRLRSVIWAALSVVSHALSFTASESFGGDSMTRNTCRDKCFETMHTRWLLYSQKTYPELLDRCLSVRLHPQWTEDHRRAPAENEGLEGLRLELGNPKIFVLISQDFIRSVQPKMKKHPHFVTNPYGWFLKLYLFVYLFWNFNAK